MAARRLVIVMLVLLAISTLAAAFIPTTPEDSGNDTTPTATNPQPGKDSGDGSDLIDATPPPGKGLVDAKVRISNAPPKTIAIQPGEELVLEVSGMFGDDVEIPGLGLVETMGSYSPAVFDIYADETGTFDVRTVETDLLVARIVVSAIPPKPELPGRTGKGDGAAAGQGAAGAGGKQKRDSGSGAKPSGNPGSGAGAGAHGVDGSIEPGPQLQ